VIESKTGEQWLKWRRANENSAIAALLGAIAALFWAPAALCFNVGPLLFR